MFFNKQYRVKRTKGIFAHWRVIFFMMVIVVPILACGGSASDIIQDGGLDPINQSIDGLPQFVAPSSTPPATHTQVATSLAPPLYVPPSGYVTNTPNPSLIYVCNATATVCYYATRTPAGGSYSNPGGYIAGSTSTPRPTYTPYPSATPCLSSFTYYFNEEIFTDPSSDNLTLGIALGNVRTIHSTDRPDQQIVAWTVEIRNIGRIDYVLFSTFQIYLAGIDGNLVSHFSSDEATRELGIDAHEATLDIYVLEPRQSVRFDMFAYTQRGEPTALAYILDPHGNTFDGTIAGGNVAYWEAGNRGACAGRVGADYTPQANLTPQPTATYTHTPDFQGN
ncbi:MAG: hypothetical protein WBC91_02355 [Phototrophicaceae bacterium]